jgi:hypothetical protein
MNCCEKQATVEESISNALKDYDLDMTVVQQFVAHQSVEIRVAWSKNTLDGFLAACNNLLMEKFRSCD